MTCAESQNGGGVGEDGHGPILPQKLKSVPKDGGTGEVYIISSGTKYHAEECEFLAKSKIPCTLADAKAKKYEPCSVCNPPK